MHVPAFQLRSLSASVAVTISLVIGAITLLSTGWGVAFFGVPITATLGWWLAPRLVREPRSWWLIARPAVVMAAGCSAIGGILTAAVGSQEPFWIVFIAGIGLVVFGVPAFVLLLVPSFAWAWGTLCLLDRIVAATPPDPASNRA